MSTLHHESDGRYVLEGRALSNGDELEVMLGGNAGWKTVTVDGLPDHLRVVFAADDGRRIVTSLPLDTPLRWPDE
jgi:hypothetical protein